MAPRGSARRPAAPPVTARAATRVARRRAVRNEVAVANDATPRSPLTSQAPTSQAPTSQAVQEQPQREEAVPQAPPFQCSHCSKVFTKNIILKAHINDRHVGRVCHWPRCGTSAFTEHGLIQHFLEHQHRANAEGVDPRVCPWPGCGKKFSRKDTVQRCIKRHNNKARRGT